MNIAAFLGHYNRKLNPKERENWKLPRLLLPLMFTVLMSQSVDGNCSPSCQYWAEKQGLAGVELLKTKNVVMRYDVCY